MNKTEYITQKATGALSSIKIVKHSKSVMLSQHKDQIVVTPEALPELIEKLQGMLNQSK